MIRGAGAAEATPARFGANLRQGPPGTADVSAMEQARLEARATGYAEGWAQGRRDVAAATAADTNRAQAAEQAYEEQRRHAISQAVNALGRAVTDLENQLTPTFTELQEVILASAFDLAEAIVGGTMRDDPERGLTAMRRAVSAAPENGGVTVSLHPDDFHTLVGEKGSAEFEFEGRRISLRPDRNLRPGDAVAETGTSSVDATMASAVARVREALRL
ncbi:hypothetical protein Acsp01_36370 [Actinoplanes sp. NBRC 101535]|nr:hypothetical protein Acsp01_36370 [Actinoplanes sp. NBRC 101535]